MANAQPEAAEPGETTLRLTPEEQAEVKRLASQIDTTLEGAVMQAVRQVSKESEENGNSREGASVKVRPGSFLEGLEDVVGVAEGPGDLSTNPEHLTGYGRD